MFLLQFSMHNTYAASRFAKARDRQQSLLFFGNAMKKFGDPFRRTRPDKLMHCSEILFETVPPESNYVKFQSKSKIFFVLGTWIEELDGIRIRRFSTWGTHFRGEGRAGGEQGIIFLCFIKVLALFYINSCGFVVRFSF